MNYYIMLSNALQILIPFVEFLKLLFDFQSFQKMKGLPRNCSVLRIFISIFSFLFFWGGGETQYQVITQKFITKLLPNSIGGGATFRQYFPSTFYWQKFENIL